MKTRKPDTIKLVSVVYISDDSCDYCKAHADWQIDGWTLKDLKPFCVRVCQKHKMEMQFGRFPNE